MKKYSGAEIFVKSLIAEGVDTIFGFPGGAVIPIYDVLFDTPQIRHVLARHEQGATHAADGYARASGRPGVALVTSGPGATNSVTGIATAFMDSVPLVVFSGQVPSPLIGNDAFQEADIVGITRPITKHNYLVTDIRELPYTVKAAIYIATSGRPGPVLVDLPKDIQNQKATYKHPERIEIRGYKPVYFGHKPQIDKVAKRINRAKKPVIYAGGGAIISGAYQEVRELAEKAQIPVVTTLMGLGAFPETHTLSLGMIGMHGTWYGNMAMSRCDLLISIGARFDDRVTGKVETFAREAEIVHIDIDPAAISKNVRVDYPLVGDARNILLALLPMIEKCDTADWLKTIYGWKMEHPLSYKQSDKIMPQYVLEKINEVVPEDTIFTTDVGQNQMWAAQFIKFTRPRQILTSGGLGTMGYGFPAAIGASFARPEATVVAICGDGGFQMTVSELATAVNWRRPVKIVILDNGFLGMVRQWQELFQDRRYSYTCIYHNNPDFVKLAESYGAVGLRADKPEEVEPTLRKAMAVKDRPVVMDFIIERGENVMPMVPAGAALDEMILT